MNNTQKLVLTSMILTGIIMTTNECTFCHSQGAPEPVEQAIKENGYFIQKMEGCP